MVKIAPSILSADFGNLASDITSVLAKSDYIHIDVMDGLFVNNISIGVPVVKCLRPYFDIVFDTHLMIVNPLKYVEAFAKAGSDIITFHLESDSDPKEVIDKIHTLGKKAGMSIRPKTDVKEMLPYLADLELVLVMSVEPGFGGQEFDPSALEKIAYLADLKKKKGYHYEIEVDGGINDKTAKLVKDAGVEVLVSGSYIFKEKDRLSAIEKLL